MSTKPFDREFSPLNKAQQGAQPGADRSPLGVEASYPVGIPRRLSYPTYPACGLLEQAAAIVPNRIATEMSGVKLTYAEVQAASVRLASWLQQSGLAAGDRVAVLLPNMPEYMIALNGIWRAGGVVVALSPLSVAEEVAAALEATQCRRAICLDLFRGLLSDVTELKQTMLVSLRDYLPLWKKIAYSAALWKRTGRLSLPTTIDQCWMWEAIANSNAEVVPVETLTSSTPAYILSTGGTTGDPKAVTLSHRNIVANAWQTSRWAGGTMGEESMLAVLPFFHSYGMSTMLVGGAALGATLIMQPRFDVTQALRAIVQHRPTVFHAVPAMLTAMNTHLRRKPVDLSSLKWVISGGAPLSPAVAEEFAGYSGAQVVQGYGLSEASPVTHVGPLDGSNLPGTIGLPLPDTDCRIVDAESGTRDLPIGEVGELLIRGPQVMLGYWNNPTATAAAIRDGWLHTGDLATVNPAGFYRIVDRKKDLIITSGFNVYPADVEASLRGCECVADVAVVGVPDAERGELVKAFVVLKPGQVWNPKLLTQYSKLHLAAHRRPRVWEQVKGDLPRNFLGKVVRRQLRDAVAPADK
jgi:long-chain acyl-CoA synthetase